MESSNINPAEKHVQPKPWLALFIIVLAAFMDLMDVCIVNVAIPSIQKDIKVSYSTIQWVIAGYSLAFAVFLITGGRLGDIFGRKKIFLIGVAGFTISSAMCGLSQTAAMLVGSRVLQGVMAAVMVPQVLSIIQVSFPVKSRGAAAAVYGAMAGLATACGPIIGGILTENNLFNLMWRPIFLINIPIGIIAFIGACIVLKESKASTRLGFDNIGMIIITAALIMLLFPIVQGREIGWPVWSYVMMVLSVAAIFVFIKYELKITEKGSPLIVLGLFKQKAFISGILVSFFVYAGVSAFFLVFTIYFQVGLGFSVMNAGLATLPWSVGLMIASVPASQLVYKMGRKILYLGSFLLASGMAGLMLTINHFGTDIKVWQICINLFIGGSGMGLVAPTLITIIISGVNHDDAGSASGIVNAVTQLGNAVGVAIIGVIFFGLLSGISANSVDKVIPEMKASLSQIGISEQVAETIAVNYKNEFVRQMSANNLSADTSANSSADSQNSESGEVDRKINKIIGDTTDKAVKLNFSNSTRLALIYNVVVFLLAFLMLFFFPANIEIKENIS